MRKRKLIRKERLDKLEIKINKDIREFTENIFFGLSMSQFIFSILACGVAVILYFVLKRYLGIETLSWVCILGACGCAPTKHLNLCQAVMSLSTGTLYAS